MKILDSQNRRLYANDTSDYVPHHNTDMVRQSYNKTTSPKTRESKRSKREFSSKVLLKRPLLHQSNNGGVYGNVAPEGDVISSSAIDNNSNKLRESHTINSVVRGKERD